MSEKSRKVLIITYYFPPSGGAGVQRTLKFVKYLRDFGWEPVVLTAKGADYPAIDETLFAEIPEGVQVYRSGIIEPYRLYRKFTGRKADEAADIATLSLDQHSKRKLAERVSEWIRAAFFVPDARIAWRFFACGLGKKILAKENIRVIYSSAPPYTTHLIAKKLCKYSKLPWVADFRDSWIGWLSAPQWRPKLSRMLEQKMEYSVLRNADRILAVSKGVKEDLLSRQPELDDERWSLLPNGYDAADFDGVKPAPKDDKITITYSGSLYGPRNPEYLIRALESLKNTGNIAARMKFRIVGRVGDPILQRIKSSAVAEMFEIIPYVTHQESLSYLLGSDMALLIIDDAPANRGILTGKLYEYIGAGKLIFALAPDGEAAQLIRTHKLGFVAAPKNVAQIQVALKRIVESFDNQSGDFKINSNLKTKFDRKEITCELAKILDEVSEKPVIASVFPAKQSRHFELRTRDCFGKKRLAMTLTGLSRQSRQSFSLVRSEKQRDIKRCDDYYMRTF